MRPRLTKDWLKPMATPWGTRGPFRGQGSQSGNLQGSRPNRKMQWRAGWSGKLFASSISPNARAVASKPTLITFPSPQRLVKRSCQTPWATAETNPNTIIITPTCCGPEAETLQRIQAENIGKNHQTAGGDKGQEQQDADRAAHCLYPNRRSRMPASLFGYLAVTRGSDSGRKSQASSRERTDIPRR